MMIDEIDRSILCLLQENARISNAEIARRVDMAASAIFERIRKLEESGIIEGYTARLDPDAVDFGLVSFIRISTADGVRLTDIAPHLKAIPEVREVHRVVGEDCFFVKVRVRDTDALAHLLDAVISPLEAVASTRTTIVLNTVKEDLSLPLDSRRGQLVPG